MKNTFSLYWSAAVSRFTSPASRVWEAKIEIRPVFVSYGDLYFLQKFAFPLEMRRILLLLGAAFMAAEWRLL